jgi:hypothetical protein
MPPHHQHPSALVRLLFEHCPKTVEDWSLAGSGPDFETPLVEGQNGTMLGRTA